MGRRIRWVGQERWTSVWASGSSWGEVQEQMAHPVVPLPPVVWCHFQLDNVLSPSFRWHPPGPSHIGGGQVGHVVGALGHGAFLLVWGVLFWSASPGRPGEALPPRGEWLSVLKMPHGSWTPPAAKRALKSTSGKEIHPERALLVFFAASSLSSMGQWALGFRLLRTSVNPVNHQPVKLGKTALGQGWGGQTKACFGSFFLFLH